MHKVGHLQHQGFSFCFQVAQARVCQGLTDALDQQSTTASCRAMLFTSCMDFAHNQCSLHGLDVVHALHLRALPVSTTLSFLALECEPGT